VDALETTSTGNGLTYDPVADQYQYNWKTPAGGGCYEVFVSLSDGSNHPAFFNLRA